MKRMFEDAIEEMREAVPGMTPMQRKVGNWLCEHPEVLGDLTLTELAEKIGVSGPTVNRFCASLGYDGFLDFSKTLRVLKSGGISHAAYFRNAMFRNDRSVGGGIARALIEKDMENVRRLLDGLPAERIAECASLMERSSSILVMGKMSAYPVAMYFEQLLSKTTSKLVPMSGSDVLQASAMSRVDRNSLVFCVAFPRYPKSIVELARATAAKGAKIVSITKDDRSPLAGISDLLFTVDVGIFSYIDLFGAVFELINVICMEFGFRLGHRGERSLAKYDRVVEDVFFVSGNKDATRDVPRPESEMEPSPVSAAEE